MKRLLLFTLFLFSFYFVFAGIVVSNGLTHIYQVHNGELIKGKIEIENSGDQPQNVKLYLQDLGYNANGTTFYKDPSGNLRSNASWIKLETNLLTLKAKEKKEVFYEMTVPRSDLQQGSYWSAIIVEPTEILAPTRKNPGFSIQSVVRYAIQIISNNQTEDLKPNLKFDSIKVDKMGSIRMLNVAISNTGSLYFRPMAIIEFYDQKTGEKAGRFSSVSMGLLPGNAKTFNIDISKMNPGKYSAVLMATDDANNAFAYNTVLDIKND